MWSRFLLAVALAAVGSLVAVPRPASAGRMPCGEVVAAMDRATEAAPIYEGADPIKIGRQLGVEPLWVQRCAETYGRRLSRSAPGVGVSPEVMFERWESDEPEEVAKEELEAEGDIVQQPLDNVSRRPKSIPSTAHEWDPDLGHAWSPTLPPLWRPSIKDDDLGFVP